jgi:uncharacterized beta-barrel protein YwiB (DUF1934 family)
LNETLISNNWEANIMTKYFTIPMILFITIGMTACAAKSVAPDFERGIPAEVPAMGRMIESNTIAGAPPDEPYSMDNLGDEGVERLVIRNAHLTLVVTDPAQSTEDISQMAQEMGGFVVSSSVYQTTYADDVLAIQASITIRVPAERLDEVLSLIKAGSIEVRSENVSGQDVTQEYIDLQSQLRNLELAEEELREIMKSATDADNVLQVFEHLRQVRQEIEITKGRIQYYEQSARMSAISIELLPDVAAQPFQIGRWEPKGTAKEALKALINTLEFLADTAIWAAICVLPIGLILGLPGWFVARAIIRRRKETKDKPEAS